MSTTLSPVKKWLVFNDFDGTLLDHYTYSFDAAIDCLKQFAEQGVPQNHRILWNDGPRLKALDVELQTLGLAPKEMGKGRNVWYCMGFILASNKVESVALHDCDILTYDRSLLARLIYPVANPQFITN